MKYYMSGTGEVYAYEVDGSQDSFIKEGLTPLTSEELAVIRAAQEAAQAPTAEQILQEAIQKRDALLRLSGIRIYPLQYAVDLGDSTPEEEASLTTWKQYMVAVNRVTGQPGFPTAITWPEEPSQ